MEESYAYDWNLFVADLGGSLGFLLGLSVLGLVSMLEEIVKLVWKRKGKQEEKDTAMDSLVPFPSDYKWKLDAPFKLSSTVVAKIDRF